MRRARPPADTATSSDQVGVGRVDRAEDARRKLATALARSVRMTPALRAGVASLTSVYRAPGNGDPPEAAMRLADPAVVGAYAAARMPATFAAAVAAHRATAPRVPGFEPRSHLDVGAGTGATTWAVRAIWPTVRSSILFEREVAAIDLGRGLAGDDTDGWAWRRIDVVTADLPTADVVTAGYLLGEVAGTDRDAVVAKLWAATGGLLVLVEPGSRAGYERILAARGLLIAAGAQVVAPCPGNERCPVAGSPTTWCHFVARLDRSPLHRRAKDASRSWEDEPFAYVAAARPSVLADPRPRVVLGRPRRRPGVVELRVCNDGRVDRVVVSRRSGPEYRAATAVTWGDAIPVPFPIEG
jgi:ribosomal protein RSM22 (predicted rRNA methylase)